MCTNIAGYSVYLINRYKAFPWNNTSPGRICSTASCAVPGGVWYTAACATPGLSVYKSLCCNDVCPSTKAFELHLDVSFFKRALVRVCLQQLCVSPVCVCLQKLCSTPGRVCLLEDVLHFCVSVFKSFVLHLDVHTYKTFVLHLDLSAYRALCCTWTFLYIRACTASVGVFVLHLAMSTFTLYLQVFGYIFYLFLFVLKQVFSFRCFNTCSKNRKSRKTTKTD